MPVRVLLVDDDPVILELFRMVLEMESFEVTSAASAAEATGLLETHGFELVVTDMRMETPTAGFDVVRAATRRSPRPAIAILTAFPIPGSDWKGSGADALFMKGQDVRRLTEKLRSLVRARPARETLSGGEARSAG